MFLKSLTLKGFKSFAEPTTLVLEPGITVVVGPNGSGKSNIVDAVAWVLGSQGPRALRSSKMEDVIFAGSARRPPLGRAEVSLTIDNAGGIVPVDLSEVTLTRTLFRSGESEYAINGAPCRLLDIQELLADTGVGRQQHVIVSQGQLATVLDARPEERRLVIEEAAGVLKHRRRREKAQRRLDATEANLSRLQDLLRELRRQLRPLERQAEAAQRHAALSEELRDLRLHLAGRELSGLEDRLVSLRRDRADLLAATAASRAGVARLDAETEAAASAVPPAQAADELTDALTRFEALRERARGLAAVLAERGRALERQRQAAMDEAVVASLEGEAARLAAELEELGDESGGGDGGQEELAALEADLRAERATLDDEWAEATQPGGRAAEARGELHALRRGLEQGEGEVAGLRARREDLRRRIDGLAEERARVHRERDEADRVARELTQAREAAEERVSTAEAAESEAAADVRSAEQERHRWVARAEALSLALDEARARAGVERLSGLAGVVGTLLELVEVEPGWEAAFEAAAGEALGAVVVDGVDAARRALARLRDDGPGGAGATLLPLDGAGPPASLALDAAAVGGEPVRAHVRSSRPTVERLLDGLLGHAVAVDGGWERALDVSLAHPGLVVVTRHGDRFAASGWRAGASVSSVTGAALDEARAKAEEWTRTSGAAAERLGRSRAEVAEARAALVDLSVLVDANDARLGAATDALERLEASSVALAAEEAGFGRHQADVEERMRGDRDRQSRLEAELPALEAEEAAGSERALALRRARADLDRRSATLAARRTALEVKMGRAEQRRALLVQRLAEVERRLSEDEAARAEAADRRLHLSRLATATDRLSALVTQRLAVVDAGLERLRAGRRRHQAMAKAAVERLDGLRRARAVAEAQLEELKERAQRMELEEAEARLRREAAEEAVRRELGCVPEEAVAARCPDLPDGTSASARRDDLERALSELGPVNPLAMEEHTALEERHRFLDGQLEDVRSARRDLTRVIRAVDREIMDAFSAAFADVAENFASLFTTLFPGGTGRLRLSDPDDLLETGIEVEARPSGKNVRRLSLLSGGERSLTALAFLFAVFRSRPSPFYLLDEVEAALDDVNLHRFLGLVEEFRREAQLLVVTHQKRTMEAADCLYGVTLQPGGSSRVVSERVSTSAGLA